MSTAPETLIQLRHFLAEELDVPLRNFGIRGRVTARRPWGYHLGKRDIYGDGGLGAKDYSLRYRRDRIGLTDASAGFDIKLPKGPLIRLVGYLVKHAVEGTTNPGGAPLLVEVLGPDAKGNAKRWARSTSWRPTPARADHEWHAHVSFYRDTEFVDKRPLFYDFARYTPPDNQDDPEDVELEAPADGEAAPDNPPMPDVDAQAVRLAEAEDALEAIAEIAGGVVSDQAEE